MRLKENKMPHLILPLLALLALLTSSACGRLADVGKAPAFTPLETGQHNAIYSQPPGVAARGAVPSGQASLWTGSRKSLFGDRRAGNRGDILTVVIQIDDKAEISNSTGRTRDGSESMGIPQMFGIPQRIDSKLPAGASMADAVSASGSSSYKGSGSVQRKEKLTLRVAATVVRDSSQRRAADPGLAGGAGEQRTARSGGHRICAPRGHHPHQRDHL